MFCKHCREEIPKGEKTCPACGKKAGGNVLKIVLAAVACVLVAAVMFMVVYVTTFGWTAFTKLFYRGDPSLVTYKDSYTADDSKAAKEKDTVVATMGDYKLTNGQLQVYYWMEVIDFLNRYGSYASMYGLDYTKPLDQQINQETGLTWQQYFLENALSTWHHDHALFLEAEAAGYQMEKEYQDYLDKLYETMQADATKGGYASVDEMIRNDWGAGADFQSYLYYMTRYYKGNLFFNAHYQDVPVTDVEIEDYYEVYKDVLKSKYQVDKNSGKVADLQYILIFPDGATSTTIGTQEFDATAWETSRQKAEALLSKWVSEGATAEGFSALVEEHGKDTNKGGASGVVVGLPYLSTSEVDVRHILLVPENPTKDTYGNATYSEEDWEACRVKAQEMLDQWVASGAKEEDFITLAKENSKDGNAKDGGIYENVTKGYMVAEFDAWIFDETRQYGDYGLVKTQFGYHLMFFVHGDTAVDRWIFDETRQTGDHAVVKSDYGYYIMRFETAELGWVRYTRLALQADKMSQQAEDKYPMQVDYSKIWLWNASLT